MTLGSLLMYLSVVICILAALYVAFSRNLFRVCVAFCIEISSIGSVLLGLRVDYLAISIFILGLLGTTIIITFASQIMGGLYEELSYEPGRLPVRFFARLVGVFVGGILGWGVLTASFLRVEISRPFSETSDLTLLGQELTGTHVVAFELMSILLLLVIVGLTLLLRRNDANAK